MIFLIGGKPVRIDKTTIEIGRDSHGDIVLDDPSVALHHAVIVLEPNGTVTIYRISPRPSMVYVNEDPVDHTSLLTGDRITVGQSTICLQEITSSQAGNR
jgi:pSer/pThr/pTyr-binding forkhead associated (FHA) protein